MAEEKSPKPEKINIDRPDINKGHESDGSNYERLYHPDTGRSIKEGYQPIRDIVTPPPNDSSGAADKGEE